MPTRFVERVDKVLKSRESLLCVGLDPEPARMPKPLKSLPPVKALGKFLDGIVRATLPHAAAYKMQLASFLRYGPRGIELLQELTERIGPDRLRILDMKANDIPNTMRLYHDAAFTELGFDAVTVSPWFGWESFEPFTEDPKHGFFVVGHSSNSGAPDFQEIPTPRGPLWQAVVAEVKELSLRYGNCGVVIGTTYADATRSAREILGNGVPILAIGVGAQGGALTMAVREGVDARGRSLLVGASRSILYASTGPEWAKSAGAEALRLKTQINQLRLGLRTSGRASA
ncbi:MAG TPA: orotidine-5'-phosphate decarboxylase [Thermoplasmata archaeon]|nr:orotidine-5'-phosphate decarboxylase [Thermoplasmata archaeon]